MTALASEFVAVADEVARLQSGSAPDCRFFQRMADQGHYGGLVGKTRQGVYVSSPSGEYLGSNNASRDPDAVLAVMHSALEKWKALPAQKRRLPADSKIRESARTAYRYPEDGLVLETVIRALPIACDPASARIGRMNRDHAWFTKDEARRWLPDDPAPGARHALPRALVSRLARFHLVDGTGLVRPRPPRPSEVAASRIVTEVLARDGSRVKLRISGTTRDDARGRKDRGSVHARLLGRATYDREKERFVEFELVAVGKRSGYLRLDGERSKTPAGIGFVLSLAPEDSPRIPPMFIGYYGREWRHRAHSASASPRR